MGAKAGRCHKSEVLTAFSSAFFNGNFKHCKLYKVDSFLGWFFFFSFLLKTCYWPLFEHFRCPLLEIQGWPPLRVGSKSIKIRQCNENLDVVDEWPLFRGAVIEEFQCTRAVFFLIMLFFILNYLFILIFFFISSKFENYIRSYPADCGTILTRR